MKTQTQIDLINVATAIRLLDCRRYDVEKLIALGTLTAHHVGFAQRLRLDRAEVEKLAAGKIANPLVG